MCVLKNSYIHPKHSRNSLMQSREKKLRCETKKNKPILSENKNISWAIVFCLKMDWHFLINLELLLPVISQKKFCTLPTWFSRISLPSLKKIDFFPTVSFVPLIPRLRQLFLSGGTFWQLLFYMRTCRVGDNFGHSTTARMRRYGIHMPTLD